MKRIMFFAAALCAASVAFGAKDNKDELVKVGGEGKVAIVNTCAAPTAALRQALDKVSQLMMFDFEIKKGEWSLAASQKSFKAAQANAAVFIVKDKSLPMSLVAMEEKWGMVNAEGLDEKCIMKETLRVATVVLGGAASKFAASPMRGVFSRDDLAKKAGETMTFDSIMAIDNYLPELGIKPYEIMTREDAIEEGLLKPDAKK